jgi:rare lipoprotein A
MGRKLEGVNKTIPRLMRRCVPALALGLAAAAAGAGDKPPPAGGNKQSAAKPAAGAPALDRSGRPRTGKASFYAQRFAGRKMADGTPMDPKEDNAASRTLPLGTKAKVTNLETGRSAVVTIQDRGPYVDGRIVDLSPATAEKIGLSRQQGLAEVEVAPLALPEADGTVRPVAEQTADAR